ncbi:MAG: tetratricopeptide repeat protein [Acidobacteriota bacterium]|nr:tetratricopeptide repeat protein [Acidobacteriota bacterium]
MTAALLALLLFSPQADFQTQFVRGLQELNSQNLPAARADLRASSERQPANPRVWIALAQTYRKLKEPALAVEAAAKAEKFGADDAVTLHSLAIFYSEQGSFAKAGDMEARYAAKDPAAVTRAMAHYLAAGQPRKAIDLALATPAWEQRADLRNLLGKAYEADGQILKTIPELREAVQLNPGEESYYFDLMQVLFTHYNFDVAIQIGEIARRRFPRSAQLALATGVAYYGGNRPGDAVTAFLETIALDPTIEQPYLFLSSTLNSAPDKVPEITARFADFEQRNPKSYLGYFLHAKGLSAQLIEPALAETLLRKSIALNGRFWEAHYNLGILLSKRGAMPEAEREFRRATELNPKDSSAHYHLFRALAALGRTKEAEAELAVQRRVSAEADAELNRRLTGLQRLQIDPQ